MTQRMPAELSEEKRKEIFRALVDAQDQELGLEQSRRLIRSQFGLTDTQIRQIEREGIDAEWPPL